MLYLQSYMYVYMINLKVIYTASFVNNLDLNSSQFMLNIQLFLFSFAQNIFFSYLIIFFFFALFKQFYLCCYRFWVPHNFANYYYKLFFVYKYYLVAFLISLLTKFKFNCEQEIVFVRLSLCKICFSLVLQPWFKYIYIQIYACACAYVCSLCVCMVETLIMLGCTLNGFSLCIMYACLYVCIYMYSTFTLNVQKNSLN